MKRENLVSSISWFLVFSIFGGVLFIFDIFLLKFQLRNKATIIRGNSILEFIPEYEKLNLKKSTMGPYIKESSMVNQVLFEHRVKDFPNDHLSEDVGEGNIWILGDSWGVGIWRNEIKNKTIHKQLNGSYRNKRIIAVGSTSPLIMNLTIRDRIKKAKDIPDTVVLMIEQTDLGQDYCQLRPYVYRDQNNRLIGIGRNENTYRHGYKFWEYYLVFNDHRSGIKLALEKVLYDITTRNGHVPGFTDCDYFDMMSYQNGDYKTPNGTDIIEYEKYFNSTVNELINEITNLNQSVKIILISHDWAQHSLPKKDKYFMSRNVKTILKPIAEKRSNVYHFHADTNQEYPGKSLKEIYAYPSDKFSHPKDYTTYAKFIANKILIIKK